MCANTADVARLIQQFGADVREYRFDSEAVGMAFGTGDGPPLILLDSAAPRADWHLTIRHELAHVAWGEVDEAVFLTTTDTMSFSERRADLFAVADLVPAAHMRQIAAPRRRRTAVLLEVVGSFRALTGGVVTATPLGSRRPAPRPVPPARHLTRPTRRAQLPCRSN